MRGSGAFAAVLLLAMGWSGGATAEPADRLARFTELARLHLSVLGPPGSPAAESALRELYALVDAEIIESLQAGGVFASVPALQERLDGFAAAWGGAAFRVGRLAPAGRADPGTALTLGVFGLSYVETSGSLRVYGTRAGAAALLAESTHAGALEVHPWPPGPGGGPQFVAVWEAAPSGGASRPLRVELWRQRGPAQVARAWSSEDAFPDGLRASGWAVTPGEIFLRHELRYPGWKPGCEGQTEEEITFRQRGPTGEVAAVKRRVVNGWHRELHAAVARLFAALAQGDARTLAELVPDRALRARLPAALGAEPACEEPEAEAPPSVVVAATVAGAPGPAPWSLRWTRRSGGWRLSGASPVLQ